MSYQYMINLYFLDMYSYIFMESASHVSLICFIKYVYLESLILFTEIVNYVISAGIFLNT